MSNDNITRDENRLAAHFHAAIRAVLSSQRLANIDERNAVAVAAGEPWCATHDYCDPNHYMAESFVSAFGREWDGMDAAIINAAWRLAKEHGFARSWLVEPHPSTPLSERWDRESFRAYWREDDNGHEYG
jgi:hypothetical protein|tara:strand:- start:124 stop:513 length:390 start_codon:yes stop_codon:yes gene_type:complete